jgi:hypothetical protein
MGNSIKKFSQTVKSLWIDFDDHLPRRMTCAYMAHRFCRFFKHIRPFNYWGDLASLDQTGNES